jgi:hypothetical protein
MMMQARGRQHRNHDNGFGRPRDGAGEASFANDEAALGLTHNVFGRDDGERAPAALFAFFRGTQPVSKRDPAAAIAPASKASRSASQISTGAETAPRQPVPRLPGRRAANSIGKKEDVVAFVFARKIGVFLAEMLERLFDEIVLVIALDMFTARTVESGLHWHASVAGSG